MKVAGVKEKEVDKERQSNREEEEKVMRRRGNTCVHFPLNTAQHPHLKPLSSASVNSSLYVLKRGVSDWYCL